MHREEIEQFAFLYLCGARDRRLLFGKEKMTFTDFNRLIYITAFFGLVHYNLKMWNQYSAQFRNQLEDLEILYEKRTAPLHLSEYEDEICRQEQWLAEFCSNVPDRRAREYLRKVVDRAV